MINGYRADGFFLNEGEGIIVESEISDISKPQRIMEKIHHFPGNKLIFLCERDVSSSIYEYIMSRQTRLDNGMEKRNINEVLMKPYLGLDRIFIIEARNNIFYLNQKGKLKRFTIDMIKQDGTFVITGDITTVARKELCLSLLRRQKKFCLPIEQIKSSGLLNHDFLKTLADDSEFVFETSIYA